MYIVVIWLSSYSSFFFRFTFQCFSSACFLLFLMFPGLLPITKKTMIPSKIALEYDVNTRLLKSIVDRKKNGFSLYIVALYIKSFLDHILKNLEFITVCATFLKPLCYVNLWQIFMFCSSFIYIYICIYIYNAKVSELKWISKWESSPP